MKNLKELLVPQLKELVSKIKHELLCNTISNSTEVHDMLYLKEEALDFKYIEGNPSIGDIDYVYVNERIITPSEEFVNSIKISSE